MKNHTSTVVIILAGNDIKERSLARTVLGNEPQTAPLCNGERDVGKKNSIADRLCQVLNIEICSHLNIILKL